MAKKLLKERFQELAGIKPLYELEKNEGIFDKVKKAFTKDKPDDTKSDHRVPSGECKPPHCKKSRDDSKGFNVTAKDWDDDIHFNKNGAAGGTNRVRALASIGIKPPTKYGSADFADIPNAEKMRIDVPLHKLPA